MRNRVIVGSVMVSGWSICSWLTNSGMTEPREYITLPYRVTATVVFDRGCSGRMPEPSSPSAPSTCPWR